jgi:hypothetical protein
MRLADEGVFGWLFEKEKYLITRSTDWFRAKDFRKHANAVNVIYYLANIKKKLLYIGKANVLGRRVKPGKVHQGMSADWDIFKYDIVKPEFSKLLERIEDHSIRSCAAILSNKKKYPSLKIGDYTLVNRNWKSL